MMLDNKVMLDRLMGQKSHYELKALEKHAQDTKRLASMLAQLPHLCSTRNTQKRPILNHKLIQSTSNTL
jgi:hypothetical protein